MRYRKHKRYFRIPGYQIIAQKTDQEVATHLGINVRTYKDKIEGWSDFSTTQGIKLSELFNVTQNELFFTNDCTV